MSLTLEKINIGKYPNDENADKGGQTVFGKVNQNFETVDFQIEQLVKKVEALANRVSYLEYRR